MMARVGELAVGGKSAKSDAWRITRKGRVVTQARSEVGARFWIDFCHHPALPHLCLSICRRRGCNNDGRFHHQQQHQSMRVKSGWKHLHEQARHPDTSSPSPSNDSRSVGIQASLARTSKHAVRQQQLLLQLRLQLIGRRLRGHLQRHQLAGKSLACRPPTLSLRG